MQSKYSHPISVNLLKHYSGQVLNVFWKSQQLSLYGSGLGGWFKSRFWTKQPDSGTVAGLTLGRSQRTPAGSLQQGTKPKELNPSPSSSSLSEIWPCSVFHTVTSSTCPDDSDDLSAFQRVTNRLCTNCSRSDPFFTKLINGMFFHGAKSSVGFPVNSFMYMNGRERDREKKREGERQEELVDL